MPGICPKQVKGLVLRCLLCPRFLQAQRLPSLCPCPCQAVRVLAFREDAGLVPWETPGLEGRHQLAQKQKSGGTRLRESRSAASSRRPSGCRVRGCWGWGTLGSFPSQFSVRLTDVGEARWGVELVGAGEGMVQVENFQKMLLPFPPGRAGLEAAWRSSARLAFCPRVRVDPRRGMAVLRWGAQSPHSGPDLAVGPMASASPQRGSSWPGPGSCTLSLSAPGCMGYPLLPFPVYPRDPHPASRGPSPLVPPGFNAACQPWSWALSGSF